MENYFASNLRKLRQNKKLSQNKLGEKMGFNQTTIARWEEQDNSPNIESVLKLADFFDVDIATFVGREIRIENGMVMNPYYGIVRIPVYDQSFVKYPVEYEEKPEDYMKDKEWLGIKLVEDNALLKCKAGDTVLITKETNFEDDDIVVYIDDDRACFEVPTKDTPVYGVVRGLQRK